MSTLQELWTNYWWVLPLALFALCMIGCVLGARRGEYCCPCGRHWDRPAERTER